MVNIINNVLAGNNAIEIEDVEYGSVIPRDQGAVFDHKGELGANLGTGNDLNDSEDEWDDEDDVGNDALPP